MEDTDEYKKEAVKKYKGKEWNWYDVACDLAFKDISDSKEEYQQIPRVVFKSNLLKLLFPIYNYSRENLTQRDTDYKDIADSCMLAKVWLESKATGIKLLNTYLDSLGIMY